MQYFITILLTLASFFFLFYRRKRESTIPLFYVEPKSLDKAKSFLKKGLCIICGEEGVGKSYTATYLAHWAKEQLDTKTFIKCEEDFPLFWPKIKGTKNACIIMDDFLGKEKLLFYNLKYLDGIKRLSLQNYIICTCSRTLLEEAQEYLEEKGLNDFVVNMGVDDYKKEDLLRIYKECGGQKGEELFLKTSPSPLSCKVAASVKDEEKRLLSLSSPEEGMKDWLKEVEKDGSLSYAVLSLALFLVMDEDFFKKTKEIFPKLCFGEEVQRKLLLTPYFERDGESVRFVHPLFHKVAREWTKEQGRRLLLLLPFVEQMAKDTTPRARYNACCASSLIGKNAPQRTLSILEELAKDSVEFVQWAAVGTLSSLPLPTEYIFPLLERLLLDERCKEAALWSLKEIGEREPHQALHVAKEWAKKEELQEGCAILLSKTAATLPEEVAPLLQELMSAKKLEVKKAVSFALGELGKKMHTFALPLLQKLLKEGLKKEVAYSLKRMSKGREKEMFSLLFQLCKEGSAGIRWMVAHTIKYLKEMDASIRFSILASLLEDEELEVRKESLRALSHLGTHLPQKVLERMQDFFFAEGSIRDVAFEGVEELARSRASEALNYARDWMKREQTPYHFASLRALAGAQEAKAKDVLKLLPHLLKDKDDKIRKEACIVLAKAGKMHPEEAFPLLEELAHSAEKVLQEGVAQALRELARSHPSKVFSLIKRWAKEESWQIQRTLILALEQICKVKPTRVFEILEDFAKSKNERMRHIAAAALGEVGKILPQKAFSLLKRLSREGNRRVRFAAANSLHHMLLSQKAGYERTSV